MSPYPALVPGKLDGSYAKLDRARVHARALHDLVTPIVHGTEARFDPALEDRSTVVFTAHGVPTVGPDVAATLGDFLTNVRAALDHLAWAVTPESFRRRKPRKVSFPILNSEGDASLDGVTDAAVHAAVTAVQPFNGRDRVERDHRPLYVLNELCNIDKHRTFLVAYLAIERRSMWWASDSADPGPVKAQLLPGALQDGDVAVRFGFGDEPVPDSFQPNLDLAVHLVERFEHWEAGPFEILDLVSVLYHEVEFGVIGEHFAPLFGLTHRHQMNVFTP